MKPTERFSNRVDNYTKFRPSYPAVLVDYLLTRVGNSRGAVCADFGSGTGILTQLLVRHFKTIYAVEPNQKMRSVAEERLTRYENFRSVPASAEQSGLETGSVDLVTAAQSFHWFNQDLFKQECQRILKPQGVVALVWNNRKMNTRFAVRYEELLGTYAAEYHEVNHRNVTKEQIEAFFGGKYEKVSFDNMQELNLDGVYGRLDSSSYAPLEGTEAYQVLRTEVRKAFEENQELGLVDFSYKTELYLGQVH